MALFRMDLVQPHEERDRLVRIINYKPSENKEYTVYTIQMTIGMYKWTLERRYREFREFDRERFSSYNSKSFLPPKRLVGNTEPNFLEQRRNDLEQYLRTVLELDLWLQKKRDLPTVPLLVSRFLDFHKYEVHGIVEYLAEKFAKRGDSWLEKSESAPKYVELDPVDLHAVSERLKLPEPTASDSNPKTDIGHVLDFLHRVPHLKIKGGKGNYGTSNIRINSLPFSLHFCRDLRSLWLTDCDAGMISGLSNVKKTVKYLVVHYTLNHFADLFCDREAVETGVAVGEMEPWSGVKEAAISFNNIASIDDSITLLRNVEKLDLSGNRLRDIGCQLQHLPRLTTLNLSNNGLEKLDAWHARIGNVKTLILAQNSIRSLNGLSRLYSLEYLDVTDNSLMHTSDVTGVGRLPCLLHLLLQGNPIESAVDHRTRVLEAFGDRAAEVYLDGEKGSQRELDTVGVRQAIRKAKEEKEELLEKTRRQISEKLQFLSEETLGPMLEQAASSSRGSLQ